MDSRETRGRALAQDPRIKQIDGALWFCPSEKSGGYLVDIDAGRCGCKDHAGQRVKCKHIHAVELVRDGRAPQVALSLPAPAKARAMPRGDLTAEEQANVRTALRFMRKRSGGWAPLARALRCTDSALLHVAGGKGVGAGLAVRLARFAGVPVDDVLSGRFPAPGTCPHCGRGPEPAPPSLPSP